MRTCLVIDDSSVVRKVANRILTKLDITVEEAATAAEGLERISVDLPQLLIVSVSLSDMASEEFVRKVRAIPGGAGTTILALLVEASLGQMTRMKRAGANGFVFKPFDRESLLERLERYIDFSRAA